MHTQMITGFAHQLTAWSLALLVAVALAGIVGLVGLLLDFGHWILQLRRCRIVRRDLRASLPIPTTAGAEFKGSTGKPSAAHQRVRSQPLPTGRDGQSLKPVTHVYPRAVERAGLQALTEAPRPKVVR